MTDLEKLTSLLDEWEVPYDREEWDQSGPFSVIITGGWGPSTEIETDKVEGYGGFFTAFKFTPDGTFARMGAWE